MLPAPRKLLTALLALVLSLGLPLGPWAMGRAGTGHHEAVHHHAGHHSQQSIPGDCCPRCDSCCSVRPWAGVASAGPEIVVHWFSPPSPVQTGRPILGRVSHQLPFSQGPPSLLA